MQTLTEWTTAHPKQGNPKYRITDNEGIEYYANRLTDCFAILRQLESEGRSPFIVNLAEGMVIRRDDNQVRAECRRDPWALLETCRLKSYITADEYRAIVHKDIRDIIKHAKNREYTRTRIEKELRKLVKFEIDNERNVYRIHGRTGTYYVENKNDN